MAKTTQPSAGEWDPLVPSSASPPPYLDTHPADSYAVLLVPVRIRRRLRRGCGSRCLGPLLIALAILSLAGFLLWPADPDVSVARLRLENVSVAARPAVSINISAALKVRVRNPDLFALDYSRLAIDIGYRGSKLGRVTSGGGRIRARAVSYIDADLHLDGIRVVEDAFYLLEDLARGSVPFDTIVEVEGHLQFFFISLPVKGRISCVVHVNPHNQTIVHQDCYPEWREPFFGVSHVWIISKRPPGVLVVNYGCTRDKHSIPTDEPSVNLLTDQNSFTSIHGNINRLAKGNGNVVLLGVSSAGYMKA